MNHGIFVSVDGPSGAGKSSFIKILSERLSASLPIFLTKEPSETEFGSFVKKNEQNMSGLEYAQLIWADRCFHVSNYILPHLDLGKVVISDRYIESSIVLQGFDGVTIERIWDLNKDFIIPNLSIILLAEPDTLESRLSERNSLSAFELKMTREQELEGYKGAVDFLSAKGFRYVVYQNNTLDDLYKNIDDIYNKILSMAR